MARAIQRAVQAAGEPSLQVDQRATIAQRARNRIGRAQAALGQGEPVRGAAQRGQLRLAQPGARVVQPPREVAQRAAGIGQHATAERALQAVAVRRRARGASPAAAAA